MDLAVDVLTPQQTLSRPLLSINDSSNDDPSVKSLKILQLIKRLLSADKLVAQIGKTAREHDSEALGLRKDFAELLKQLLKYAEMTKDQQRLYAACGDILESLLFLLSTAEFIESIETLLSRGEDQLGCKALRAFEVRVQGETLGNKTARDAVLHFLPRVASVIETKPSLVMKHAAISCVDKILEKYGRKDVEAVAAAAVVLAGPNGLRNEDERLQVMALLCLTSCAFILGERIIPLLPQALPVALEYLGRSARDESLDEKLHEASLSFLTALLLHVPWMITGPFLDDVLRLSHESAEAGLNDECDEGRMAVLRLVAKQLDAKECFGALERGWEGAAKAGPTAMKEHIELLDMAVERQTKAVVVKHAQVLECLLLRVLDLRRLIVVEGLDGFDTDDVSAVEVRANEVAIKVILKMNDTTFRPIFTKVVERAGGRQSTKDERARMLRLASLYAFLYTFFDTLKVSTVAPVDAYQCANAT